MEPLYLLRLSGDVKIRPCPFRFHSGPMCASCFTGPGAKPGDRTERPERRRSSPPGWSRPGPGARNPGWADAGHSLCELHSLCRLFRSPVSPPLARLRGIELGVPGHLESDSRIRLYLPGSHLAPAQGFGITGGPCPAPAEVRQRHHATASSAVRPSALASFFDAVRHSGPRHFVRVFGPLELPRGTLFPSRQFERPENPDGLNGR